MTIANDNVNPEYIQRPHLWGIKLIRRFMLIFGPLSSAVNFTTFGVLIWLLKSNEPVFLSGWQLESILPASLIVFFIRSRQPITRSSSGKTMMMVADLTALFVLILPYTSLATTLELFPLPIRTILILVGIITLYIITAEITKMLDLQTI